MAKIPSVPFGALFTVCSLHKKPRTPVPPARMQAPVKSGGGVCPALSYDSSSCVYGVLKSGGNYDPTRRLRCWAAHSQSLGAGQPGVAIGH